MKTIANGYKISSYVHWVSLNSIHYTSETIPLLLSQSKWSHSVPTLVHDVHVTSSNISDSVVKGLIALESFTIRCNKSHGAKKCRIVVAFFLCCRGGCAFRSVTAAVVRSGPTFIPKAGWGWHYIRTIK